ncbi:hypothetical protein Vretimale_10220 [Volvox reticuliferus]|uniref:Bifunctional inhibitor/plant lipid transfer protein/seed storage helical domain-containing protein n=1 Tax=Volvox reticuliferus TaxID=1737510 RepID=A0A8J4GEP7_9CHLO|nr:hypothetical protein Vretifemale_736 [Volvox reticuliferus]GIM05754.1 hypothetical protein Vretimale_10220 [Volvox reticuliferus]
MPFEAMMLRLLPVFFVVLLLATRQGCHAGPPDPPQCVYTGLAFYMACTDEVETVTKAMTGTATADPSMVKVDVKKLHAYLVSATAPEPSKDCCEAAKTFNDLYCFCAPAMIDEFSQFVDLDELTEVALHLQRRCPGILNSTFVLYMEPNCPERPVYTAEMEAAEQARLAKQGIVPIAERVNSSDNTTPITTLPANKKPTTTPAAGAATNG